MIYTYIEDRIKEVLINKYAISRAAIYTEDEITNVNQDLFVRFTWTPVDVTDDANNMLKSVDILNIEMFERHFTVGKLQSIINRFKFDKNMFNIIRDKKDGLTSILVRCNITKSKSYDDYDHYNVSFVFNTYKEN